MIILRLMLILLLVFVILALLNDQLRPLYIKEWNSKVKFLKDFKGNYKKPEYWFEVMYILLFWVSVIGIFVS